MVGCDKCAKSYCSGCFKSCPDCHQESEKPPYLSEENVLRAVRRANEEQKKLVDEYRANSPQEPASWEKIFDERYIDKGTPSGLNQRAFKNHKHMVDDIKSFIQSLLLSQKSKLLESMGKMKGRFGDSSSYNFALEDVEELIKGL